MRYELLIIGGGATGLGALRWARENDVEAILVEHTPYLGGMSRYIHHLRDCFDVNFLRDLPDSNILLETTALRIGGDGVLISSRRGIEVVGAEKILCACGVRERHVFELGIHGSRVAGILFPSEAIRLIREFKIIPGRRAVVYGNSVTAMEAALEMKLSGMDVIIIGRDFEPCISKLLEEYEILIRDGRVISILGRERVERVVLEDSEIQADTFIIGTGYSPNKNLLTASSLKLEGWKIVPGRVYAAGNIMRAEAPPSWAFYNGYYAARRMFRFE